MDEESRLAMYEAQAIAIEKQLEIDRLKKEREELIESVRRLGRIDQGNSGQSTSKDDEKRVIEGLKVAEMDDLKMKNEELEERLRRLELDKEGKTKPPEAKDQNDVWSVVNGLTGQFANIQDQIQGINSHITRLQNGIEENSRKLWEAVNDLRQQSMVMEPSTVNIIQKEKNTILIMENDRKGDSHVLVLSPDRTKWITLKLVTPYYTWNSGSVYLNEEIYLIGGQKNRTALYKLNKDLKWMQLADMNMARENITNSCLECNGYIWVFGGVDSDHNFLKSVERYDPKEDKWTLMPVMEYPRSRGAVAFWNDGIIISGGRNDDGTISNVEYFNLENSRWTELPNMPSTRSGHFLAAHNNKLITIGGSDRKTSFNSMWELDMQKIHMQYFFDLSSTKWRPLPSMKYNAYSFAGNILDNEIYAIGGLGKGNHEIHRVEIFNGEKWRNGPSLPYPMWDMPAIIIPQDLADRLSDYNPE